MAIHGAGRRDYSDAALHPPAIFRWCEWWRLISLRTRSQSCLLSCPSEAAPPSEFMFGVFSSASTNEFSSVNISHYFPRLTSPHPLPSLSLSTDREDQSILCTWVKTILHHFPSRCTWAHAHTHMHLHHFRGHCIDLHSSPGGLNKMLTLKCDTFCPEKSSDPKKILSLLS